VTTTAEELSRIYGARVLDVADELRRAAARIEAFTGPAADGSHVTAAREVVAEVIGSVGNLSLPSVLRKAQEADAAADRP